MAPGDELCQERGLNCVGSQISMLLVNGLFLGRESQYCYGKGLNDCALDGVALSRFVYLIGAPHRDRPLDGFVVLQWVQARLIII